MTVPPGVGGNRRPFGGGVDMGGGRYTRTPTRDECELWPPSLLHFLWALLRALLRGAGPNANRLERPPPLQTWFLPALYALFASGVMLYRRSECLRRFFALWEEIWSNETSCDFRSPWDQCGLYRAVRRTPHFKVWVRRGQGGYEGVQYAQGQGQGGTRLPFCFLSADLPTFPLPRCFHAHAAVFLLACLIAWQPVCLRAFPRQS